MYHYKKTKPTELTVNKSYEAERIEEKVMRIMNNKEPIKDGAPLIYTERKDGVLPAMNIKTDRWEVALEGMDIVDKTHKAKRQERHKTIGEEAKENMIKEEGKKDGGAEPISGTDSGESK